MLGALAHLSNPLQISNYYPRCVSAKSLVDPLDVGAETVCASGLKKKNGSRHVAWWLGHQLEVGVV